MSEPWLIVDTQAIQNPDNPDRGIARYVREQARAMDLLDSEGILRFVLNPKLATAGVADLRLASGRCATNAPGGPGGVPPDADPFLYYVTSPFEMQRGTDEIWPRYARSPRAITAVTLYDLIPLRFASHYLAARASREIYEPRLDLVRNADLVLAISEATAADAVELLGLERRRVVTIGAGVSEFWQPPDDRTAAFHEVRASVPRLRQGFVLFTGGIEFRKNMEGLLAAYATVPPEVRRAHQLVITCKMDAVAEQNLRRLARDLKIAGDTLFTNFVPDAVLRGLYQSTDLFVFPSLYEGFGLPVVEAMACGAPAIASDRSSMREIVTRPEARFDPDRAELIGHAITATLANDDLRAMLRSDGAAVRHRYTWKAVAERTIAACREVRNARLPRRGAARRRPARPTLAIFSPMPPEASGVADYTWRLATALAPYTDVDVFVDGDPGAFEPLGARGTQILHYAAFAYLDALGRYDEVIYAMGNSGYHAFVYDALSKRPGVVLAHEVRYTGFYSWYAAHRRGDPPFFADAVRTQHPAAPTSLGDKGFITPEEADRHGVRLVAELMERSTRFLVHSQFASDVARSECPKLASRVQRVHFGMAAPLRGPRREIERPRLVSTFGMVSRLKRTEQFLRAARLVARQLDDVRFAIVGEVEPDDAVELRSLVRSLGLEGKVELTGRLEERSYEGWLTRTTCAVQLRASTNGESSGAIGDCLRAAIPTIVSDLGPVRELPSGTVRPLPAAAGVEDVAAAIIDILMHAETAAALSSGAFEHARRSGFGPAALSLLRAVFPPPERRAVESGHARTRSPLRSGETPSRYSSAPSAESDAR